jgi:hypothetical protein
MHYSKEEKAMWVDDWRQSGKSAWSYAKVNGLNPQTFIGWTRQGNSQPLVEVPKQIFQAKSLTQEILIEKGEVKIHIPLEPVLNELYKFLGNLGKGI